MLNHQAHRGMSNLTSRGPNYRGVFYGFSDFGTATITGKFARGKAYRVQIERSEGEPAMITSPTGSSSTDSEGASADLICRAFAGNRLENRSRIVPEFDPERKSARL